MPEHAPAVPLEFTLDEKPTSVPVHPGETLLDVLQRLDSRSVRRGCGTGDCGACAVLVDGVTRATCVMFALQAQGRTIETVDSPSRAEPAAALRASFWRAAAVHCGQCTPGMQVSALELLQRDPDPTAEDVREALSGNLCRCTGYHRPVRAVLMAAESLHESLDGAPTSRAGARDGSL